MKKILIIAATINRKKRYFTGLAMMIELFQRVISTHYKCVVCSISPKLTLISSLPDVKIGNTSLLRLMDYVWLMIKSLAYIICNPKSIFFICPAPTKLGFKRDYILVKTALLLGCKIILQIFTGDLNTLYDALSEKDKRRFLFMYNKAVLIPTEGNLERDFFASVVDDPSKVVVIENALPEDRKDKTTDPKHLDASVRLLFLNNMIVTKGYWDVLNAVDILVNEKNQDVVCDFVGRFMDDDKKQERMFFDYIESHNLKDRVRFTPGAFGEDKKKLFERSHFFLLPSYFPREGKPTAILEAMSYGCVPIVTNYREIPEMVNDKNGLFVESQNGRDIAYKIEQIINDKEKYVLLSSNCLNDFEDRFTPERYRERMLNYLNKI